MDAQYYPRDVRMANEHKFLCLKQGNMSVMECAVKFNEPSCSAPTQVTIEEI